MSQERDEAVFERDAVDEEEPFERAVSVALEREAIERVVGERDGCHEVNE